MAQKIRMWEVTKPMPRSDVHLRKANVRFQAKCEAGHLFVGAGFKPALSQ